MSLAFVRGMYWRPVNSLHKGPVTWKMFPFDDIIMANPLYDLMMADCQLNHWEQTSVSDVWQEEQRLSYKNIGFDMFCENDTRDQSSYALSQWDVVTMKRRLSLAGHILDWFLWQPLFLGLNFQNAVTCLILFMVICVVTDILEIDTTKQESKGSVWLILVIGV